MESIKEAVYYGNSISSTRLCANYVRWYSASYDWSDQGKHIKAHKLQWFVRLLFQLLWVIHDDIGGEVVSDLDEEGIRGRTVILPIQIGDGGLNNYTMIFSIIGKKVTGLLPSSGGSKSFTTNDLPLRAENIILRANLDHSYNDHDPEHPFEDYTVTAGACYYTYTTITHLLKIVWVMDMRMVHW